ncbi:MAG: formylglycine-generating enzyme family protein [Phormidesmis sp. RL_2_1]|nr:formylglycine-generating enzyme family protein [Phormidesmis sp. RL_2_1]
MSVWHAREKSPPPEPGEYPTFRFETVKVNSRGDVVKRMLAEATMFIEDLGEGVTLEMVKIPGGKFMMGAPSGEEGANEAHRPQQEVTVPEFWMGKYAVTRSQWQAAKLLAQTGPDPDTAEPTPAQNHRSSVQPLQAQPLQAQLKDLNRPIENVFWADAVEFCQWLSQHSGRAYQLPSGAQWEYACRAGTTTPFYFGETITPDLVNYNGNYAYGRGPKGKYRQKTTEVGSFPPNLFGLYDMHGNVWEWCLDGWHHFHLDHLDHTTAGSAWRLSGQKKFLCGGSWSYLPTNCRSAYRLNYPFHSRIDDIGFRVVCQSLSA